MRAKPHRGTNGRGYADRRLAEIRDAPYRGVRVALQEILAVLAAPNPGARRLVKGGR